MRKLFTTLIIFLLVGLLPAGFLLSSCGGTGGCNEVFNYNITNIRMKTTNVNGHGIDTSIFNHHLDILKVINIDVAELRSNTHNITSFYNAAYALSCVPPHVIQDFEEIKISALNSFTLIDSSDLINIGDDLTTRFLMGYFDDSATQPVHSFIQNPVIGLPKAKFKLVLADQPYQETLMEFKIEIELTDGSQYLFENEILKVK